MTVYRLPFDDDGDWQFTPQGNWDDPGTNAHQPYAFDFRHPVGGNIRAVRAGVVTYVENNEGNSTKGDDVPGYGTLVVIRHLDGTAAAYVHLEFKSPMVKKDQYVSQGQVIAKSGNTGHSFAPHLHFAIHIFWNSVTDLGPEFPLQFQDKNHVAWRPFIGDPLASNNSKLRQDGWRKCKKCHGLFFVATLEESAGTCPAGGKHNRAGMTNYILVHNSTSSGQADWRWCNRCQGLFFGGNPGSKCPAGGAHNAVGSGNYVLNDSPDAPGESEWRWCKKCQGLFFGGDEDSKCPDGGAHTKTGSGNYTLVQMGPGDPQTDWRWCNKCQGLFFGGNPNSKCPAGGAHSKMGSGNYVLVHDYFPNNAPGEPEWRWCNKCQGLFYAGTVPDAHVPSPCKSIVSEIDGLEARRHSWSEILKKASPSEKPDIAAEIKEINSQITEKRQQLNKCISENRPCPGGGNHSKTGSGNYVVVKSDSPKAPGQTDWRWCKKCQGMFFGGNPDSKCPAGGAHSKTGSGNYRLPS